MSESLLAQLADRLARPPDGDLRKMARLHLLDWLACVAGARDIEAGHLGSAIGSRGWEMATYAGSAIAMEEGHCTEVLSPGPAVWPAAMSMGSAQMDARLDAAIRGYEASLAIGAALDDHHKALWDVNTTAGVFGSCAAFGSLIGFAAVEYANAMGNAGSVSGGLLHFQHDEVSTRNWHAYHAVRTGRDAALHVHYGALGPQALLEGPQGFFAAMTHEPGELADAGDGWLLGLLAGEEEEALVSKMHKLGAQGQLSDSDVESAIDLALRGDDADAIDRLVEGWLA